MQALKSITLRTGTGGGVRAVSIIQRVGYASSTPSDDKDRRSTSANARPTHSPNSRLTPPAINARSSRPQMPLPPASSTRSNTAGSFSRPLAPTGRPVPPPPPTARDGSSSPTTPRPFTPRTYAGGVGSNNNTAGQSIAFNRGSFNADLGSQANSSAPSGGYAYGGARPGSGFGSRQETPNVASGTTKYGAPPSVRRGLGAGAQPATPVQRSTAMPVNAQQPKKTCPICTNETTFDFRHVTFLSQFVTEHSGMILPARLTGVCAKQQRKLAKCIKRSRAMGLMSFTGKTPGVQPNLPRMG
eukprot:CFRG7752T1